ncbi:MULTISPECIES: hypothetical protein [unclassified Exiguobacterium]|uniref:hypothetical protein n=1 Tax=unclassified Exiguobacterium TaxID=2644629 RepID=UPI00103AAD19|nr:MULTISPECIES: hypothetical protein [unclassified Exiguobacterium]TCI48472.1 hypothetical protein EVJ31_05430 [Exiguobacterium sp. SH5S32]TCI55359.1 hypothetical protein EVJ25_05420 [Exiguobacterium sp. SH1S4]TCI75153.1 hypothetical protein EVJ23_05420 [Exiguobacterium sp. SH1S1]
MSKRGFALFLTGMIIIIAISVAAGVQYYNGEQRKQASEQAQQKLHEHMTAQGWYTYVEGSTVVLFTNEDETILGLGIMNSDGGFSASTWDTIEEKPFDSIHFGNTTDEYIGIRFNEKPEDVAYVRLSGSDWSETYTVNDPRDEGYVMSYLITLDESQRGRFETLETLDGDRNVMHAEEL